MLGQSWCRKCWQATKSRERFGVPIWSTLLMIHSDKVPNGSSHLRSLLCFMICYQDDPLKVFGIATKLGHLLSTPNCRKTRYDMTRYSSFVAYAGRCHIKTGAPIILVKSPCIWYHLISFHFISSSFTSFDLTERFLCWQMILFDLCQARSVRTIACAF